MEIPTPMSFQDWISIIGLVGGVTAFIIGIQQYRNTQRWKVLEFVANEVKEFESNKSVQNAMLMLDWNARNIDFTSKSITRESESKPLVVTDEDLAGALVPHSEKSSGFSDKEVLIRETFDDFFNYLSRFEHYIESRLVSYDDFHPYLRYWLEILSNNESRRKSSRLVTQIEEYIHVYDYRSVEQLIKRYRDFK
jgi:hypothetical protein